MTVSRAVGSSGARGTRGAGRRERAPRPARAPRPRDASARSARSEPSGRGCSGRTITRTPPSSGCTRSTRPGAKPSRLRATSSISAVASGRSGVSMTRWLRAANGPMRPSSSTCRLTRVRQRRPSDASAPELSASPASPRPPASPAGETVVSGSETPPNRVSASSSTRFFSTRCSSRSMWPKSAPPGRSAGGTDTSAAAHTCGRRWAEASRTSTTSARQKAAFAVSVSSARTRSPGMAPSTKTTRPSCRATKTPP